MKPISKSSKNPELNKQQNWGDDKISHLCVRISTIKTYFILIQGTF